MPSFKCTYRDQQGTLLTETKSGTDVGSIQRDLRSHNCYLISIEPVTSTKKQLFLPRTFSQQKEIVVFTRQLSNLLSSGVHLPQALQLLFKNTKHPFMKKTLAQVVDDVEQGRPFWQSLLEHPKIFKPFYAGLVKAGEEGENLDQVMEHLADYMENQKETTDALTSLTIYPTFLCVVGILLISFIMNFVFPRILFIFNDIQNTVLPISTRILISINTFFNHYGFFILLSGIALCLIGSQLYRIARFRLHWDEFVYRLPILGPLQQKIIFSHMAQVFGLVLQSGVSVVDALAMTQEIIQNKYVVKQLKRVEENVINGLSLSHSLNQANIFSPLAVHVIAIGEETGKLEETFLRETRAYKTEARKDIEKLFHLLEPSVILIVALAVGFIVLAILSPIFQMNLYSL